MYIWTAGMVQRLTDDIALCGIWSIGLFVTQEVVSPWFERSRGHFRNLLILF
jgi:hypothetical protein